MTLCKCGCGLEVKYPNKFFNHNHYGQWLSKNKCGKDHPNYSKKEIECCVCKIQFLRKPSVINEENNFCSPKCYAKWLSENRSGEDCPAWRGGTVELFCDQCGKPASRYPCEIEDHVFCCTECFHQFNKFNTSGTKIEIIMQDALVKENYNFETKIKILNYYPDILLTDYNIVIECDGDYWHGNESIFKQLTDWQVESHESDRRRDESLMNAGFITLRFWENDIINDINKCMQRLRSRIQNATSN